MILLLLILSRRDITNSFIQNNENNILTFSRLVLKGIMDKNQQNK